MKLASLKMMLCHYKWGVQNGQVAINILFWKTRKSIKMIKTSTENGLPYIDSENFCVCVCVCVCVCTLPPWRLLPSARCLIHAVSIIRIHKPQNFTATIVLISWSFPKCLQNWFIGSHKISCGLKFLVLVNQGKI